MRSPEELKSKEFNDDMGDLCKELDIRGMKYEFKRHRGANPELLKVLGYYPTGEWHVFIEKDGVMYSVIRGMASFGQYEVYGGDKFADPMRFETPKELIDSL